MTQSLPESRELFSPKGGGTELRRRRLLLRRDFRAANKARCFINHEARRFDVAVHAATGAQFAALAGRDVAVHSPVDDDRARLDVALDSRLFADSQTALGTNPPLTSPIRASSGISTRP